MTDEFRDKLATILWNLVSRFEDEDEVAHRKLFYDALIAEHYWHNRQHIWREFLGGSDFRIRILEDDDDESDLYTANIYKPNGESIIAAMSSVVPQVNFYPDDADSMDDVTTANVYQRISTLIQKQNKAWALITRCLYILYNQHYAAFWNYTKWSTKYGKYTISSPREIEVDVERSVCPNCGAETEFCEACQMPGVAQTVRENHTLMVEREMPKHREIIKVFGPLHVRVAPYVQDQEDTPYVILDFEQHPSLALRLYPEYKEKIGKPDTTYRKEERSRLYYNSDCSHLDSWKCVWLRNWTYELVKDEDVKEFLEKTYPDGLYLVFVNHCLVEIKNENLDNHWTFNHSPMSNYIAAQPLGSSCLSIQDATNELINLSMDTIKHGIPQTFADSQILDLARYEVSQIEPGKVWPIKSVPAGRSIGDFILTTRTATLSQEVRDVADRLQQLGQLTTGAFPSIYGGILSGSRTASEYAQSRAQALQRLSSTWMMLKEMWADMMLKAVRSYIDNLNYDERIVQKDGSSYINIWIKRAELSGKVGRAEPEIDEQLPTTWAQQRDVLLRLIEMNSPAINEIFMMPENSYIIKNALGMKDFVIPGYNDKMKQRQEIQDILAGNDVEIDQMLDNHAVEASEVRLFLVSDVGRDLKLSNPEAYQKIYTHYIGHLQAAGGQNAGQQRQP